LYCRNLYCRACKYEKFNVRKIPRKEFSGIGDDRVHEFASLPPRRPGIKPRSNLVRFVVDGTAMEQISFKYFGFPYNSFIPLNGSQSSPSIIQGWYNRPINGRCNSELGATPDQ
jgi:hypothetical protein